MNIVFDRAVAYYDQTRGLPNHIQPWVAHAAYADIGLSLSSAVLEVGVGTGRIALPFARHGYRYTGVDLSRPMMRTLHSKAGHLPIDLVQADIAGLPFRTATFDAVVAVHIFHLVGAWSAAMDEVRRVLKPGGVLLHGHTKHDNAPEHDLRRLMQEHATAQQPATDERLSRNEVNEQLRRRWGEPHEYVSPPWQATHTPRSIIDQFANRIWSATWRLDDAVLTEAVEAGRAWALQRWGTLDTPFTSTYRFAWQVYRYSNA